MPDGRAIESRATIELPYPRVRDVLRADALSIFHRATKVAEERSGEGVAALSVNLAGIEMTRDIIVTVRGIREDPAAGDERPVVTSLDLEWKAADSPGFFPTMKAELRISPESSSRTEVMLVGTYKPPMGILGSAIDAVVGRLAEASVHGFVAAVVEQIGLEPHDG
jgi:hypothetical protein